MSLRRSAITSMIALTLAACTASSSPSLGGGSTTPAGPQTSQAVGITTPTSTTRSPSPSSDCTLPPPSLPSGTISANFPTALAFGPDGRLFFAERSGMVRVWEDGAARVFATVRTVTAERDGSYSERGLLGLAISPTFARDHFVYAFYSDSDYAHQHVIRWSDCGGSGRNATVLLTFPSGGDCCHKGGRLAFGPDGKLYVTLGEEHSAPAAQNTSDVRGKILRYNPDGTVPADNPFGRNNPVWAYGLRNTFGIAFSAGGQLAITVNGPTGDTGAPATGYDTVILSVLRGAGYQWPLCYGYDHRLASTSCGADQHGPDWSSETSTVVPTGVTFVDASGPAPYAGHLIFCTFDMGMLVATPATPHATMSSGPSGCRLDVKEGPDHALYYTDTGHIYRLG